MELGPGPGRIVDPGSRQNDRVVPTDAPHGASSFACCHSCRAWPKVTFSVRGVTLQVEMVVPHSQQRKAS